jgi:hypothetical protein
VRWAEATLIVKMASQVTDSTDRMIAGAPITELITETRGRPQMVIRLKIIRTIVAQMIGRVARLRMGTGDSTLARMITGKSIARIRGSPQMILGYLIIGAIGCRTTGELITTPMMGAGEFTAASMGARDQVPLFSNLLCTFQIPPGLMGWP